MDYEGLIFRPTGEDYSLLLQVTVGCSHSFTFNHASNYLSIKASLPREKEKILKTISSVIDKKHISRLQPKHLYGL